MVPFPRFQFYTPDTACSDQIPHVPEAARNTSTHVSAITTTASIHNHTSHSAKWQHGINMISDIAA